MFIRLALLSSIVWLILPAQTRVQGQHELIGSRLLHDGMSSNPTRAFRMSDITPDAKTIQGDTTLVRKYLTNAEHIGAVGGTNAEQSFNHTQKSLLAEMPNPNALSKSLTTNVQQTMHSQAWNISLKHGIHQVVKVLDGMRSKLVASENSL